MAMRVIRSSGIANGMSVRDPHVFLNPWTSGRPHVRAEFPGERVYPPKIRFLLSL